MIISEKTLSLLPILLRSIFNVEHERLELILLLAAQCGVSPNRLVNVMWKLQYLTGANDLSIRRALMVIFSNLILVHCYVFDDMEYMSDAELVVISGVYYVKFAKALKTRVDFYGDNLESF